MTEAIHFVHGPTPYLTPAEVQQLADWAVQMGRIDYGRTKEQISAAVKKLLDRDGRQNPIIVLERTGGMHSFGDIQSLP